MDRIARSARTLTVGLLKPSAADLRRAVTAQALALPVVALSSLAVSRILVDQLGREGFAVVSLAIGTMLLLPFADLGSYAAITNAVASRGSADPGTTSATLLGSYRRLVAAAASLFLGALALELAVGWDYLLGVSAATWQGFGWLIVCTLGLFAISILLSSGVAILRGSRRQDLASLVAAIAWPAGLSLLLVLAAFGVGGLALGLAVPLGVLLASGVSAAVGHRVAGVPFSAFPLADLFRFRTRPSVSISAVATPALISMAAVPLAFQLDRFVLARTVELGDIADYVIIYQLYSALITIPIALAGAVWPVAISRRASEGAYSMQWVGRVVIGFAAISLVLTFCLLLGAPLVARLVLGEPQQESIVWAFAGLLVAQGTYLGLASLHTDARGFRLRATLAWLMVAVNLPLTIILAVLIGASGPPTASAISVFFIQLLPMLFVTLRRANAR